MRKRLINVRNCIICMFLLNPFLNGNATAQNLSNKNSRHPQQKGSWTVLSDPFGANVFVENDGQFNTWAKTPSAIKYAINSGSGIFFTQHGVTFKLNEVINFSKEEFEKIEHGEKPKSQAKTFYVNMNWKGCNPNAIMEVSEQSEGYYTFGEKGYENVKAKGYKKLTYKNLYPGIDVEYIIPEKGGIKYSLIVQHGADLSLVKMNYTGDVEKIKTDNEGNIIIKTEAGDITDHAPQSYYKDSRATVPSFFELKENTVSFKIPSANNQQLTTNNQQLTLIIDPWTIGPFGGANIALNVDYDDFGNVFVSGYRPGPHRIAKYTSAGTLVYSYTTAATWEHTPVNHFYSRPTILRHSGTVIKGEGLHFDGPANLQTLKLNAAGTMSGPYALIAGNNEMWNMFYNNCTNRLYGFGGGNMEATNCQILDTTITAIQKKNINTNAQKDNDISDVVQDVNGDAYLLLTCMINASFDNKLMKSLAPNYNAPETWIVPTGYTAFNNIETKFLNTIEGVALASGCKFNALAVNKDYLFSYDGKTVKAWRKTDGAALGSVVADASYNALERMGIDADECNNVYVGGKNKVHVYNFDGSTFTTVSTITTGISGEVYDVRLDQSLSRLIVGGNGFLTVANAIVCEQLVVNNTISGTCTNATACVEVLSGGTPPYSYIWNTGATTSCIFNVPSGIYTVTITDNSCIKYKHIDTLTITGGSVIISAV
ncbi:MAG: hypothetical protein WC223_02760, partial [Bacteroidales bacterium]